MHGQPSEAEEHPGFEPLPEAVEVDSAEYRQAWARLLAKVYEIDPFVCPQCGTEMRVIAFIQGPEEINKILAHLAKVGRAPPGFDPADFNLPFPLSHCPRDPAMPLSPSSSGVIASIPRKFACSSAPSKVESESPYGEVEE